MVMPSAAILCGYPAMAWGQMGEGPKPPRLVFLAVKQDVLESLIGAVYRIESGANYRRHIRTMTQWLHKELHGCLPDHELGDVAWDAQAQVESALASQEDLAVFLLDYSKFF